MKIFIAILLSFMTFAPAIAQRAKVVQREGFVKTTKATPSKSARPTNDAVVSGERNKNSAYKNLTAQKSLIEQQIKGLDAQRATAPRGAVKKITKQLEDFSKQLVVVERLLATFPTQNDYNERQDARHEEVFRSHLDSVAAVRIAVTDPYAGRISNDPELERMYREYLAQNRNIPFTSINSDSSVGSQNGAEPLQYSGDRVFRIMIAISRNAMRPSEFGSITNIVEQRMPSGGYVYYQGSYDSKSDAERACLSILAGRKFRDAFVVAMVGNKRVPL